MSNEWHTPVDLIRDLQRAIGGRFDLDPASGCEPEPIAETTYTKEDDGLEQPWYGNVFVNPPYDRTIKDWMAKARSEARKDRVDLVVALIPARMSTQWWHNHVNPADVLCVLEGRLRFGNAEHKARFPCVIAVYGESIPERLSTVMSERGTLYEPREVPDILGVGVGSRLDIQLDDRSVGFPDGVDPDARAVVQSGRVDDGLVEFMAVQPAHYGQDHETYFLVSFPEDDPTDVRCTVTHTNLGWRHVPLTGVEPVGDTTGPNPLTYVA